MNPHFLFSAGTNWFGWTKRGTSKFTEYNFNRNIHILDFREGLVKKDRKDNLVVPVLTSYKLLK